MPVSYDAGEAAALLFGALLHQEAAEAQRLSDEWAADQHPDTQRAIVAVAIILADSLVQTTYAAAEFSAQLNDTPPAEERKLLVDIVIERLRARGGLATDPEP